jgi:hypothetical protein
VSIQESVFRVLSLPLCYKSKKIIFVSSSPAEQRDRAPKPRTVIMQMEDDDEDVFLSSVHDR